MLRGVGNLPEPGDQPLHGQVDSSPLNHQGKPHLELLKPPSPFSIFPYTKLQVPKQQCQSPSPPAPAFEPLKPKWRGEYHRRSSTSASGHRGACQNWFASDRSAENRPVREHATEVRCGGGKFGDLCEDKPTQLGAKERWGQEKKGLLKKVYMLCLVTIPALVTPFVHPSPWDHELPSWEVTAVLLSSLGKLACVGALECSGASWKLCSLSRTWRGAGHRNRGSLWASEALYL